MTAFLVLHKPEENRMAFFTVVSAKIRGEPVPAVTAGLIVGLLVLPVGAWLEIPISSSTGMTSATT